MCDPHADTIRQKLQLRQDALAAWDAYRTTGLHITAKEADAWLAKLDSGEHAATPKCHA
jgi:predicted transcriptional regulator